MNAQWEAPYGSRPARWTGWLLVIGLVAGGAAMLVPHAAAQAAGDADAGRGVYTAYLDTLPAGARNFGPEMDRDGMMRDDGMMDGEMMDGGMMDRMMGVGWVGLLVAIVLFVLLAGLVALVVALVVNQRGKQSGGVPGGESPRDILDRRYAAGELSAEEYRQAREDLDE